MTATFRMLALAVLAIVLVAPSGYGAGDLHARREARPVTQQ